MSEFRLQRHSGTEPQTSDNTQAESPKYQMDVSAALQVVGTWEFVQRILLNLPLKQLFILQRVSKTFENVIKESPQIQRKMFLRADGAARSKERDRSSSTDEAIYQLGKLHLNPIFPPDLAGNLRAVIHDPHGPCMPNASRMLQGPNRCEELPPISLVLAHSQQRQCMTMFATMRSENGIKILYDRSRRRQMASWRRMFVAQPPVKSMASA